MKIPFEYKQEQDKVYVTIFSETLELVDFMIFDYDEFYAKYKLPEDKDKLKEDMVDTMLNTQGGIPYSKDEIIANSYVNISSDLVKNAKKETPDKPKILRARFNIKFKRCNGDYRPLTWPLEYPYWCTGEGYDYFTIVAYVKDVETLYSQWPEAEQVDIEEVDKVEYSSRFQKPDWYKE